MMYTIMKTTTIDLLWRLMDNTKEIATIETYYGDYYDGYYYGDYYIYRDYYNEDC